MLAFPSPSIPQLRQRCDNGATHLALLRQLAEILLETAMLDFSSPAVITIPAGVADALARVVSDHLPAITAIGLLPRLLDALVRLLQGTAGMPGTAGLVVSALNELFLNAGELPESCVASVPAVIAALAQNAALPQEWFESASWPREDELTAERQRLRQSCQDVVLAMAGSVGVVAVMEAITAVKGSLCAEESATCLCCGVVDAIEEMALPLFPAGVGEEETRGSKRHDIPADPLITPYDGVLEYLAGEMGRFARHPLLLSTGLQVLFDFDNWTFSRGELCRRLFEFLLEVSSQPSNRPLLSRLFSYLARLFEAPVFALSIDDYLRLCRLAPAIPLTHLTLLYDYARLLATAASYLAPRDALDHIQRLVAPAADAIPAGNEPQRTLALRAAAGILDGCLAPDCANCATAAILSALHGETGPAGKEVLAVLNAAVHACDAQITPENAREVVAMAAGLLGSPLRLEALEVLDALVAAAFQTIPAEQRGALLGATSEMLTWVVQSGHVREEVDAVKLLLRLQYAFLKEEKERMGNREVIGNVTGMLVGIIQGMVNEEELIRIVIRSLLFLVNVAIRTSSHS